METKDTIIKIILVIICVFCLVLVWSSFRHLRNMEFEFNEKKATLVKENLDLKDRLESIQEAVNQKKDALESLEKEKEAINSKLEALKGENRKLSTAYNQLQLSYSTLTSEKTMLSEQFESLRQETLSLANSIDELEKSPLVQRLKEALEKEQNEMMKKVLEEAIRNIELIKSGKEIDLTPIVVVGSSQGGAAQVAQKKESPNSQAREGKVLSVDEKNNLIVVDIGRKDKVKEGDRCGVLKNEEEIANGGVISVRYNISAVYIDELKYKNLITDIKEGDEVLITEQYQ